ncbi:MAG: Lpg1974 family pore-forming outer membrane protein [Planctomycetaceae bacterium]
MKRCVHALALLCVCAASSPVWSQLSDAAAKESSGGSTPFDAVSYEAELSPFESMLIRKNEELEERIQRLEAEQNHRPAYNGNPMNSVEQQLRQQDAGSGGLFGSVEVTFLKPAFSGAQSVFGFGTGRTLDTDYQTGLRYGLGYLNDSGFGIRASYWSYDNDFGYTPPYAPNVFGIQLQTADTELLVKQQLRHFNLDLSGGLRYGTLKYTNPVLTLYGPGIVNFEGVGPTAAIQATREIGNTGLSVFGNVRGSMLVGDIHTGSLLLNIPAGAVEDEIMTVFENQIGAAWSYDLTPTFLLQVRAAWETQYWANSTLEDDFYGIGSNLALMGPTLAVELRY